MQRVTSLFMVLVCGATLLGCREGKQRSSTKVIRVGLLQHASSIPLVVADENRYFHARGLSVEFTILTPQEHMPALLLNKVDVLSPSSFPVIMSTYQQHPGVFQCYLVGGESTTGDTLYGIVVRKDSTYKSLGDLVGRRIGSSSKFTVVNLRNVLRHRLGDRAQSTVVRELGNLSLLIGGLKNGELDAAVLDQPILSSEIVQSEFRVIEKNFRARYLSDPYWSGCGVARSDWVRANRESYEAFLDSIDDALRFARNEPLRSKEMFVRRVELKGVSSSAIGMYMYPHARFVPPSTVVSALQSMLYDDGLLKETFDAGPLFDKR